MTRNERVLTAGVLGLVVSVALLDSVLPVRPHKPRSAKSPHVVSEAWYCPMVAGEGIEQKFSASNLNDRQSVHLRRSVIGAGKATPAGEADIPPNGVVVAGSKEMPSSVDGVAVLEAQGGPIAAGFVMLSTANAHRGAATAACTNSPSGRWFFADSSSERARDTTLWVANPFLEEATVSVRLLTAEGSLQPSRLKDIVVPPRSAQSVLLADYLLEKPGFGVDLSASTGRLVVWRLIAETYPGGRRASTLTLGARGPKPSWMLAGGTIAADGEEEILLANPSRGEALLQIAFQTSDEQISPPPLEELALPAGKRISIRVSDYLPRGTKHGTTIFSMNGTPIVAERLTHVNSADSRGVASEMAVPAARPRWDAGVGLLKGEELAVHNPGSEPALVKIVLHTDQGPIAPERLQQLMVGPGRQVTIGLDEYLGGRVATAVVEARRGRIVVESYAMVGSPYFDISDSSFPDSAVRRLARLPSSPSAPAKPAS